MSEASQGNPAKMIAIVLGVLLLLLCCGGITSLSTVGVVMGLSTSDVPEAVDEGPVAVVIQPRPIEVSPKPKPMPSIASSAISAPPTPDPAFDSDKCDDIGEGGMVNGPDCATARISCDQQLIGHTVGGVDKFDTKFYEKKFCWPGTVDHDSGDERVYKLTMPPGEWRAFVTLHSPCADLDVVGIRWDEPTCPDMSSMVRQCEMKPATGTTSETIELTSQTFNGLEPSWYIVVEGKGDAEGPFSLHVQCAPGLGGGI